MKRILIILFLTAAVAAPPSPSRALARAPARRRRPARAWTTRSHPRRRGSAWGEALMQIAESAGFPAVFTQSWTRCSTSGRRARSPEYTVTYVMPGLNNELDEIVQSFYPYGRARAPSRTRNRQAALRTTERTRGGWYVASSTKDRLVAVGPPRTPTGRPSDSPWKVVGPVLVLVLVAALGGLAAVPIRRRPQTARSEAR